MINRVATFARNEQMLTASLRTQSDMARLQMQQATGLATTEYGGLGTDAKRTVDLQVSIARAQTYIESTQIAVGRVEVMHSACGTMADLLTDLRSQITAATSATAGTGETLKAAAQELIEDFALTLNRQYEGRYLFAGARTDTVPVVITDPPYAPATSPSSADTSYYQGDSQIASVRISDTQVVAYGATADNPAFEKALRTLNLIANIPTAPLDQDTLTEANDLLVDALDSILAVQSRLSLDASAMEGSISSQQDYIAFSQTLVSGVVGVDVAEAAAKMSSYEAQLQASYSAMAKIQGLNLFDYLR